MHPQGLYPGALKGHSLMDLKPTESRLCLNVKILSLKIWGQKDGLGKTRGQQT